MYDIPTEIWFNIFKHINMLDLSNMMCVNHHFYNLIQKNKWNFIDCLIDKDFNYIPKTRETFDNFKYCINWTDIILKYPDNRNIIPNHVIEWIDNKQDLEYMCIYQNLSEATIYKLFNKINWKLFLTYQTLPLSLIKNIVETYDIAYGDWYYIWLNPNLDFDFIIKYQDFAQWRVISSNKNIITYDLIQKYGDRLFIHEITRHGINESIVNYYLPKMDHICWINVSQFTKLSEEFIKKHIDKLNLQFIVKYQDISEEYLITIIDNLGSNEDHIGLFQSISLHQKLSYDFMLKYKDNLHIKNLIRNKNILRNDIYKLFDN